MDGPRTRSRSHTRILLAVLLALVPLGLLAARYLEVPGDRVTVGAVAVGTVLVIGALALPALLFAGWRSDREGRSR